MLALAALTLTILPHAAMAQGKPAKRTRTYLLSLAGLPLGQHTPRLEHFEIETYGVDVAAVCRIPLDWQMVAGAKFGIFADINGAAAHGAGWLNRRQLAQEGPLLLVKLDGSVQRRKIPLKDGEIPPTFKGKAIIEDLNAGPDEERTIPLTYANIRQTPARACPPLPASRLR